MLAVNWIIGLKRKLLLGIIAIFGVLALADITIRSGFGPKVDPTVTSTSTSTLTAPVIAEGSSVVGPDRQIETDPQLTPDTNRAVEAMATSGETQLPPTSEIQSSPSFPAEAAKISNWASMQIEKAVASSISTGPEAYVLAAGLLQEALDSVDALLARHWSPTEFYETRQLVVGLRQNLEFRRSEVSRMCEAENAGRRLSGDIAIACPGRVKR